MAEQHTLTRHDSVINIGMCGLEGANLMDYWVEATVTHLELNRDGFMVDHNDIHTLVSGHIKHGKSCEVAIQNCIKTLEKYFFDSTQRSQRMRLRRLKITLGLRGGTAKFTTKIDY